MPLPYSALHNPRDDRLDSELELSKEIEDSLDADSFTDAKAPSKRVVLLFYVLCAIVAAVSVANMVTTLQKSFRNGPSYNIAHLPQPDIGVGLPKDSAAEAPGLKHDHHEHQHDHGHEHSHGP